MLLPGWEGRVQWDGPQISLKNVLGRLAVATVGCGVALPWHWEGQGWVCEGTGSGQDFLGVLCPGPRQGVN